MTASPGIPRARIVPSGRTREGVTTPPPHPLRRGAAVDHALWARVTRYARCADSGLDPDQWFPVSVDPASARLEAAAAIAVCTGCLVRGDCLVLSLRHWDIGQHGVWGGLVAADRARLRSGLTAAHSARGGMAAVGGGGVAGGISRMLRRLVKGGDAR
jgi:Transcription factor WhiB